MAGDKHVGNAGTRFARLPEHGDLDDQRPRENHLSVVLFLLVIGFLAVVGLRSCQEDLREVRDTGCLNPALPTAVRLA